MVLKRQLNGSPKNQVLVMLFPQSKIARPYNKSRHSLPRKSLEYRDYVISIVDGKAVLKAVESVRHMDTSRSVPIRPPLTFFKDINDSFFADSLFDRTQAYDDQVISQVRNIAVNSGILDLENSRQVAAFKAFCPAGLLFYPNASADKMVSALSFINLLWFVDDILDDKYFLTTGEAVSLVSCVANTFIFQARPSNPCTNWPKIESYALAVRGRLLMHMSAEWVARFGQSYRNYAFASLKETNMNRQRKKINVDQYQDLRMLTSAVYPCQELLAMIYGFDMPDTPLAKRARHLNNRIISFSNDIFSFEKEFNSNSMNLVKLIMHHYKTTLDQTLEYCVELLNKDIAELLSIEKKVRGTSDFSEDCLIGLKFMIQGNAIFSRNSKRYCRPSSPFIDLREQYLKISQRLS
ncbi:Germacrene A synthase [Neolecta irregularis DAH-3]|uniref:Terpene synthase n=1 Tax=Neolecta irregularis (strain DAH-3) TaxID=1198029 RepID=A0A1U7LI29_NEOID|nr:Germacrene A synthase [Neolecta irregularis DAH-3]|eukprot:OLL22307.1 Germacrene A synthase [Neolecta irregularis DAH-3]